ncbi:MAG TPA: hypothetical protein VF399_00915 [bacterium]
MRQIIIVVGVIASVAFAGRLGIGASVSGQQSCDYQTLTIAQLPGIYYGGEFHIQAEALPHCYIEPAVVCLNNPQYAGPGIGMGLRLNIQPRIGRFFLAPFFGVEGMLVLYNDDLDVNTALQSNRMIEYIETATARTFGSGFAGVSLYLGKAISIDCNYRYLSSNQGIGVEMTTVGLNWYINW